MDFPVQYDLSKICRFVCEDECQETLLKWKSRFNAVSISSRMLETVDLPELREMAVATLSRLRNTENADNQHRNLLCVQTNSPQDKLLQLVASHRGEVLEAFLWAVEKEYPSLYKSLRRDFDHALNASPCKLSSPDRDVLQQASRMLLKEELKKEENADERRLLLCPKCDNVMDDPVLLTCLHTCCRECVESSCPRCHRNIKGLKHETNEFVLNRIAAVAKRMYSEDGTQSNGRLPSGGGQGNCSREEGIPMCSVHSQCMIYWCNTCGDFRCAQFSADICGASKHAYCKVHTEAKSVREWIEVFSEHVQKSDDASNGMACLPAQSNQERFTKRYVDILTDKKECLRTATDSAFENAGRSVAKHYDEFSKEATGMLEQLNQAYLYASSIKEYDLFVFRQRKLIFQQLRLLLFRTGKADQCCNLPEIDELCSDHPRENVTRLLIECLPDDYNYSAITEELLGRIIVETADSPAHLFWVENSIVKSQKENLNSIAKLKLEVENVSNDLTATIEHLHQSRENVKRLQQQLDDKEKEIKELRAKMASECASSVGDSGLEGNLLKTMVYVIHHLTEGEVANVTSYLRSRGCLLEREEQSVKEKNGAVNQAEALIKNIIKKGSYCRKLFLEILGERMNRQDIVDVILTGKAPDICC